MARVPTELRPLIEAARVNGYKVVPSGRSKHLRVIDSKGKVVQDSNGPVIVSSTPGDVRMRDMHVKRFIGAGIIKPEQDPWKPAKPGDPKGPAEKRDEDKQRREAARLHGLAEASRARAERTRKVRARWEPIMAKLGGYEKRGMMTEAAQVIYHFATSHGRQEAPASVSSANQLVGRLKRGDTLSHESATIMELLLDDLEHYKGDIPLRWTDLLREARGLPPRSEAPPPGPAIVRPLRPAPEPPQEPPAPPSAPPELDYGAIATVQGDVPRGVPTLALEALAEMVRGRPPGTSIKDQIALAKDILAMELNWRR